MIFAAEGAVVETINIADTEPAPETVTVLPEPKLKVGRYCAPAGLVARAAVSVTLPVKPPLGAMMIAAVLPVIAPRATVTEVPVTVNDGLATVFSVPKTGTEKPELAGLAVTASVSLKGIDVPTVAGLSRGEVDAESGTWRRRPAVC